MIGAIIGDIVGSRFKFDNCRSKEFEFFTPDCEFTGNLVMMLAVTKALTDGVKDKTKLTNNTIKYMQALGQKYPKSEYGVKLRDWIYSEDPRPFDSDSSGPAVWISAIPQITSDLEETLDLSHAVSEAVFTTLTNRKGAAKAARVTGLGLHVAKTAKHSKRRVRDIINHDLNYNIDFTLDDIREKYRFYDSHQETIPVAIEAFLESNDFEDAIRNAISVGGDSSTIAAVAGAFAEAYYKKVPPEMERMALSYLTPDLLQIYIDFLRAYHLPRSYLRFPPNSLKNSPEI